MCIIRRGDKKGKKPTSEQKMEGSSKNMSLSRSMMIDNNDESDDVSNFKQKEEEIEKRKMEMRGRVQIHLNRIEHETKRLATIRQELEALSDPTQKELSAVRKRIDVVDKELKPLELTVQKKEKDYKDTLDAFDEKNKEKVQLVTRLMELVGESEKMRMEKLEELSKSIEPVQ